MDFNFTHIMTSYDKSFCESINMNFFFSNQYAELLFEYSKTKNTTMKQIYLSLFSSIEKNLITSNSNTTELLLKFLKEKTGQYAYPYYYSYYGHLEPNANITKIEDWKYFNGIIRFYTLLMGISETFNWDTKNTGSFFIRYYFKK